MAASRALKRRATYEDLVKVPDHLVAEILDGELYASPRPAIPHARASSALGVELGGPFDRGRGGPGGWWILDEPELHFGEEVVVPDLAGWRRERLPQLPGSASMSLAPDWVCEVVSPSTERIDRVHKLPIYARERVRHLWLINPSTRTLEVLRLSSEGWLLVSTAEGSSRIRAEPFEAIELELPALWGNATEEAGTPPESA
jgi:Uma2 family endonuclease